MTWTLILWAALLQAHEVERYGMVITRLAPPLRTAPPTVASESWPGPATGESPSYFGWQ